MERTHRSYRAHRQSQPASSSASSFANSSAWSRFAAACTQALKRSVAVLLMVSMTSSVSGASLVYRFCGDDLTSVALALNADQITQFAPSALAARSAQEPAACPACGAEIDMTNGTAEDNAEMPCCHATLHALDLVAASAAPVSILHCAHAHCAPQGELLPLSAFASFPTNGFSSVALLALLHGASTRTAFSHYAAYGSHHSKHRVANLPVQYSSLLI
jgi:hypothetical protein